MLSLCPLFFSLCFCVPFSSMTRVYEEVVYTDQISFFSIAQDRIFNTLASIVISVFVVSTLISIVCAFLTQKHSVAVCGNILSFSSIWIFASVLIAYYRQHNYQYSSHAAFLHIPYPVGVLFSGVHRICGQVAESASCEHSSPRAQAYQVRAHSGTGTPGRRADKGKGRRIASFLVLYLSINSVHLFEILYADDWQKNRIYQARSGQ